MSAAAMQFLPQLSVQDIAHAHRSWLESAGQLGKRANFRGADLRGQVFHGLNFSQASFRNASLQGARFVECQLEEADFAEADVSYAQFESCQMKLSNFARALLNQSGFERCAMERAVFLQAMLDTVRFENVNLREANFREASLPGTTIVRSELQRATLRSIQAPRCHIEHVRLDAADAKEACFDYSHFSHVAWFGAMLRGASFEHAECYESDLSLAGEVDATAVAAVERTMAQLRASEVENIEKLQSDLAQVRGVLDQRGQILAARERQLADRELELRGLSHALAQHVTSARARASTLRAVAACWWMISAMIITLIVHQAVTFGLGQLNWLEIALVLGACVLTMAMFISSALMVYRASAALLSASTQLEENI